GSLRIGRVQLPRYLAGPGHPDLLCERSNRAGTGSGAAWEVPGTVKTVRLRDTGRASMGSVVSVTWEAELAAVYDDGYARQAEPSVVEPIAGVLAALAGDGAALEFAVGTGRIALALSARGVAVTGIELSPHMAERLRAKPGADAVPVIVGDMTTTRVDGSFA